MTFFRVYNAELSIPNDAVLSICIAAVWSYLLFIRYLYSTNRFSVFVVASRF